MLLFQGRAGTVVKLQEPGVQCTAKVLGMDSEDLISFDNQRSIITRMTFSQQVNIQFLHTFGALVYVYVFGDRMGQIGLSGLSFACSCPSNDTRHGAELMYLWYKARRASKRPKPLRIMIGKQAIEGFVTGFHEDVVDPSLNLVQWGVNLASLPEDI
jgi:hypothetical protein